MTDAGTFLIAIAAMTFVSVGAWITGNGKRTHEETLLFLGGLGLRQHQAITAMMASAVSFLILGLALRAMPGS